MRHLLGLVLVAGWFFGFEHPVPTLEGVKVKGVVGPFPTEEFCKAEKSDFEDTLNPIIFGLRVSPCTEVKES